MTLQQLFLIAFLTVFLHTGFSQETYIFDGSHALKVIEEVDSNHIMKARYANGNIAYTYKLFHKHVSGIYKVYHPNGKLKYRGVFMNGVLNGSWKEFDDKGKLIVTGQYKYGKKQGSWFYFNLQKVEVYKQGIPFGRWRIDEGWIPRTLFVYKKGVLIRNKRSFAKKGLFQ